MSGPLSGGAPAGALGRTISQGVWYLSEYLNGPPVLHDIFWLRLCLPHVAVLLAVPFVWGMPGKASMSGARRDTATEASAPEPR